MFLTAESEAENFFDEFSGLRLSYSSSSSVPCLFAHQTKTRHKTQNQEEEEEEIT